MCNQENQMHENMFSQDIYEQIFVYIQTKTINWQIEDIKHACMHLWYRHVIFV